MLIKEATQQAYQIGAEQALIDAGLMKTAIPVVAPAVGAAIGALGGGLSDDPRTNTGIGTLRGAAAGLGAHLGAGLGGTAGVAAGVPVSGIRDVIGEKAIASLENNPKAIEELAQRVVKVGGRPGRLAAGLVGMPLAGLVGGGILGGVGAHHLMKKYGPERHQSLAERLGLG